MMAIKKIVKVIYRFFLKIIGGMGWKSFGLGSFIHRPDRLIGKKYISIGENVSILYHSRMEVYPGITDEEPELVFEDGVSVEQNFHCIVTGNLIIGSHTTISANVFLSDCNHDYTKIGIDVLDQKLIHRDTSIGSNCFVGFGAVILPGAHLGRQCIVGANSVVMPGNYGDFVVLAGSPAKVVKKLNMKTLEWEKVL